MAVDVWTRPLDSEDGMRWMRWTPASVATKRLAFTPTISAEASFKWPFAPRLAPKSLNVQLILMENRSYMRSSSEANEHASAPPIPALTSSQTEEGDLPVSLPSAEGGTFAERLHSLRGIIYLAVGCKLHSATASNVVPIKSVPPKLVWIAQKMKRESVLNQVSHTAEGTSSKGQITIIAAGRALERAAKSAFEANCGQVPRDRTQALGSRTAATLAKTSLRGPHATLPRRRRTSVTQTTLCLRAADLSWEPNLRSSAKMMPPRFSTADISGTAPSTKEHCQNISRPQAETYASAKNLVEGAKRR